MVEPRISACIEEFHSRECGDPTYLPGYYICRKDYSNNKFYWNKLKADYYGYICNDSSYYANSKEGDVHWGSIEPVKRKCINCKHENIDYLENICKNRCYEFDEQINDGVQCALGFGGCTKSRYGTIKEGPVIKTELSGDNVGSEGFFSFSYVTSIDSTQKRPYICWSGKWHEAATLENNFYYDIYPAECTYDFEGQIISGKKNKYVCDDEKLRIATQEEIDAGFVCTSYLRYQKKCGIEEKE